MIKNLPQFNKRVFIVAEIGKNFIQTSAERSISEYLANAKELVRAAAAAGADAVKFQTHNVEDEQLDVQIKSPHFDGSDRYSWVKRNTDATPLEFWEEIKKYCDELDIVFFSTPMSRGAAKKIEHLVPLWKVGSGDILDFALLDYLVVTGKPIIISSGMTTPEELDVVMNFLKQRTNEIILLHCVSKYPCPPQELSLATISHLAQKYGVSVGFSDHSLGHEAALAAVALGAKVIEKHFSFSRDLWGSDHRVSLLPHEFKRMVDAIRHGDSTDVSQFGSGMKVMDEVESSFRPLFRKSLMAAHDITAGTVITKDMLYAMRPQQHAGGLPSEAYESVLGKKVTADIKKYDPITSDILSS